MALLMRAIQKIQGQNFNAAKVKPVAENFERFAFTNASSKEQYVQVLRSKISSITQPKPQVQSSTQQPVQQQYSNQQQTQQPQYPQKDFHNAPIPASLLQRLPPVFPQGANTWSQIMPHLRSANLNPKDAEVVKRIHALHLNHLKQTSGQMPVANATAPAANGQGIQPSVTQTQQGNSIYPQQVLLMQQQQQARQKQQQQQQMPAAVETNAQTQTPMARQQSLQNLKAQGMTVIRKLQAEGKMSMNLSPAEENAFLKKYMTHMVGVMKQQQQVKQQQQQQMRNTSSISSTGSAPLSLNLTNAQMNMKQPMVNPTPMNAMLMQQQQQQHAPKSDFQLPTNQNQGQRSQPMYSGSASGSSSSAMGGKAAQGTRFFPGLVPTEDDWKTLRSLAQQIRDSPVSLKDQTNLISDDEKRKIVQLVKTQSHQLMVLCQSIIIPNFWLLTHNNEATKKIMYAEKMLKQIIEHLMDRGQYFADMALLGKIHAQITKFLSYVKETNNKRQQQQTLHNSQKPPQGMFTNSSQRLQAGVNENIPQAQVQAIQRQQQQAHMVAGVQAKKAAAAAPAPAAYTNTTVNAQAQRQQQQLQQQAQQRTGSAAQMSVELQNTIKNENIKLAAEESRINTLDAQRKKRRELVAIWNPNSKSDSYDGAIYYFLANLADSLGLQNEEKNVHQMAANPVTASPTKTAAKFLSQASTTPLKVNGKSHGRTKSASTLTPSAILATPTGLNNTKNTYPKEHSKRSPWAAKNGVKISPHLMAATFRVNRNGYKFTELVGEAERKRKLGAQLLSLSESYPTPPSEDNVPAKRSRLDSVSGSAAKQIAKQFAEHSSDCYWDFDSV